MQSAWLDGFVESIAQELERLQRDEHVIVASYAHYTSVLMAYKWQKEFLVTIMKDMDFGWKGRDQITSILGGKYTLTMEKLSSLLSSVLEKLGAVRSLEEATIV